MVGSHIGSTSQPVKRIPGNAGRGDDIPRCRNPSAARTAPHTTVGSIPSPNTHTVDVSTGTDTWAEQQGSSHATSPLRCTMSRHHRSLFTDNGGMPGEHVRQEVSWARISRS